jgi:cytochrome c556
MMHDKMKAAMDKMKGPKVVKQRRLSMRAISKANKAMKAAAKKGNTRGVVRASLQIIRHANALPRMFPRGTGRGKLSPAVTRSTPAIWKQWGKFIAANNAMRNAATQVAIAANAGNKTAGLKGIGKTCGGCHKPFRGKKVNMKK